MDDKNFNQKTASEWIKIIEDPSARIRENDIYPLIRDWLFQSNAQNVLDIGCGQGVCSAHLGNIQTEYVGIDPSSELIFRANELYANASRIFTKGSAYEIPFQDKHFYSAVSVAVWHLLNDIAKASSELNRVLKDDGKFLIITADSNQSQSWTDRYEEKKFDGPAFVGKISNPDGTITFDTLYLRSLDEIKSHLEAVGLKVSRIEKIRSFVAIFGTKD